LRVNVEWLREWVAIESAAEQLADELTIAGLEVDAVLAAAPELDGVVVAQIIELKPHPNADRLSLCTVDDGQARYEVVCGAPNVAVDLKVPFAAVGTQLPGHEPIQAVEFRGVNSHGMLCSAKELGLADDASGLLVLDLDAPIGASLKEYLKLDDTVIDIDLTPNRGDCFSVIGIAREIAAKRSLALSGPDIASVAPQIDETFAVELENDNGCPRFAGRIIRRLETGRRSPDWMRERLRRAGLRSIHPVVDVTNYVMLELGQPLHAYNLTKLVDGIVVRSAHKNERLTLLDRKDLELDENALVIADGSGAIGLAGIMGGASTAVESDTADVFLESAFFSPDAILGRARQFGLHTDASLRFERGVDPTKQERALERATMLLQSIAGGEAGPLLVVESKKALPRRKPVELAGSRLESVLGIELQAAEVERLLSSLGMKVESTGDAWNIVPPSFRFDITIEEDLIEEVGRMVGYDNIPITPGSGSVHLGTATEHRVEQDAISDRLIARGYSEVITYSFVDESLDQSIHPGVAPVRLANPISADMNVMRRSLWPGLLLAAQQNMSRQQPRARLFEIGVQFAIDQENISETNVLAGLATGRQWPEHWDLKDRDVDYHDVKSDVEAILSLTDRFKEFEFHAAAHPALNPGRSARIFKRTEPIGWLGSLHPKIQRQFDLKSTAILFAIKLDAAFEASVPNFQHYSKFPSVRRDLAVIVDEDISVQVLLDHVRAAAGALLNSVAVFDVYRGKGIDSSRKSIGIGLILQDASRTLVDGDADHIVESVTRRLEHELGATIRTSESDTESWH